MRNLFEVQRNFQVASWETLWLHLEWLISCFSSEKKSSDSIIRNFQDFFHKIYNRCRTKIWSVLKKSHKNFWLTVSFFRLELTSESLIPDLEEKKVFMEIKWLIFTDALCWNLNQKWPG